MQNALGAVQSVLVLGGASDIGAAIAERLVRDGCRSVVLAGRHPEAMEPVAERLRAGGSRVSDASGASEGPGGEASGSTGAEVALTHWDALDTGGHGDAVKAAWEAVPGRSDVDCVVLAAGVLGEQRQFEDDPASAADALTANYTGAVTALLHVAQRLREQGHGTIVVLSSVAGERARKSNFVYGSSKAGLDAFAQGLADSLVGSGVRVVIVRPGFVHTSMTAHKEAAPLATTADKVADAVADALAKGREIVWVPPTFRYLMVAFRHLPRPLWRKVSANR